MDILSPLIYNQVTREYNYMAKEHGHTDWEISIFLDGYSINTINGKEYPAPSNRIFFLGPRHRHSITCVSGNHRHRDIYISKTCFENLVKTVFNDNILSLADNTENPVYLDLPAHLVSEFSAQLIFLDTLAKMENTAVMQRQLADSIIVYLLGYLLINNYIEEKSLPDWFLNILNKLQQPEVFSLRINEIIAITDYSHSQFSLLFKKYMKITLLKFVVNLRLEHSMLLLRETDRTILDISYSVGYNSVSFYIAQFKKQYGITPYLYRKHNRTGAKK